MKTALIILGLGIAGFIILAFCMISIKWLYDEFKVKRKRL
jgi:hypothetical protein